MTETPLVVKFLV